MIYIYRHNIYIYGYGNRMPSPFLTTSETPPRNPGGVDETG
jgi:hypothetical protein